MLQRTHIPRIPNMWEELYFNPSKLSTESASMTNSSECTHESAVLGLLVFSSVTQGNMVTSWAHLSLGAEELRLSYG